jgi:protein phosphatase 1E
MLYVAWAGDSEALLAKRGRVFQLVQPHKADREVGEEYITVRSETIVICSILNLFFCLKDERKRIQEAGGVVLFWGMTWRVNGQLAVSRAIGTYDEICSCPGLGDRKCSLYMNIVQLSKRWIKFKV